MQTGRVTSIDQFRGFAILAMVLANFTAGMEIIPGWLKHAEDISLTVIDLIAPLFIFSIGLTYKLSFQRRQDAEPGGRTYSHFITRYLAIIGIGAIISAGETLIGENTSGFDWGVLQAIGMAGLLTLVFLALPTWWRVLIGLSLLFSYQILLDFFLLPEVLNAPHGGLFGSLSWAAMLILSTSLADLFHAGSISKFGIAGFVVFLGGLLLSLFTPVSKNRVSASYDLISLGISTFLFLIAHWLSPRLGRYGNILSSWGRNPLVLYVLHYLLIGVVYLPGIPGLYSRAQPWVAVLECLLLVGILGTIASCLARRKIILSI